MARISVLIAMLLAVAVARGQAPQDDSSAPASADALAAAPACCRSLAGFPVAQVSLPIDVTLVIDRSAPAFPFAAGKSFFRMIELPPNDAPYVLSVESHVSPARGAFDQGTLFCPVIVFLDDNRKPLGVKRSWIFRPSRDASERVVGMKASVEVGDRVKNARYILVLTENGFLSKAFEVPPQIGLVRIPTGMGSRQVASSRGGYSIPFSVEGRITLRSVGP